MNNILLSPLVLIFLFTLKLRYVDAESVKDKFKTCSQTGFCSRQRDNMKKGGNILSLVGEPKINSKNPGILELSLVSGGGGKVLFFDLHLYKEDKIRFILRNNDTSSVKIQPPTDDTIFKGRWSPPAEEEDVILLDQEHFNWPKGSLQMDNNKENAFHLYEKGDSSIKIFKNPFYLLINDYLSINSENLLFVEDEEGIVESFQRHSDPQKVNGLQSIGLDLMIPDGDSSFYGLPEHALPLELKPSTTMVEPIRLFNCDIFPFPLNSTTSLYGSIPYLTIITCNDVENNYGIFWNNPTETWVSIIGKSDPPLPSSSSSSSDNNKRRSSGAHFMSETGVIDLWVWWSSTPRGLLSIYYGITGTPALPPLYSLGYHQSRWNYHTQEELLSVSEEAAKNSFPVDVFWLDIEYTDKKKYFTWNEKTFPTPSKMINLLWDRWGRRLVTILDPHIKEEKGYWVYESLKEKISSGFNRFLVRNPDKGGSIFSGQCWPGTSVWPNFAYIEVRKWWASLFKMKGGPWGNGLVGVWIDMNEPSVFSGPEVTIPRNQMHWIPQSGWVEHRNLHNLYGLYQHRATYTALSDVIVGSRPPFLSDDINTNNMNDSEYYVVTKSIFAKFSTILKGIMSFKKKLLQRPFVLTRSFYAGSQRWGPAWTGDIASNWDHLKQVTPMLLSLSISGMPWVGADVSGFYGPKPSETLQLRWLQSSIFHPFMRHHSHLETERREPWLLSEKFDRKANALEAVRLRYYLLPQLYSLFFLSSIDKKIILPFYLESSRSAPPLRPMFFEFPLQMKLRSIDNQFMFGDSLLVYPITSEVEREVTITIPASSIWYNWWGPHHIKGKSKILYYPSSLDEREEKVRVYGDKIPTLLRGGYGIILRDQKMCRDSSSQMLKDPLLVHFALNSTLQSQVPLIEDDFISLSSPFSSCLLECRLESTILKINLGNIYRSSPLPPPPKMNGGNHQTHISTFSIFLEKHSFIAIKSSNYPLSFKSISESRFDLAILDGDGDGIGGWSIDEEFEIFVEFIQN